MEFNRESVVAAFLAETSEGLQEMEQSLMAFEAATSNLALIDSVFRVVHTIKGNAAALEFDDLAGFAHCVEDLLESLRKIRLVADDDIVSLLLKSVDALRRLISASASGNGDLSDGEQQLRLRIAQRVSEAVQSPDESPRRSSRATAEGLEQKRSLRVEISKLDLMLNLSGEIAIAQGRMGRLLHELELQGETVRELIEANREIEQLFKQMQEQVMNVRLAPIGPLFQHFQRPVRDLSRSLGKIVRLDVSGGDVEVDTRVFESLKDPLLHMIRNAVDHGIEVPDERQAAGKERFGTIRLSARQAADAVIIELSDDGRGFNRESILSAAFANGLVADGDKLSDSEVFRLCFSNGLSTSSKVTGLSGRGVGMDVVRRNIDALRGKIGIESTRGQGSTITIKLPLTLAIIEGFAVEAAGETFILPMEHVAECVDNTVRGDDWGGVISLRGEALNFLRLRHLFGLSGSAPERESIIVLQHENGRTGLAVDHLRGETQSIIKPLNRLFQDVAGVSGSTILGDGRVALILDVNALIGSATPASHGHTN